MCSRSVTAVYSARQDCPDVAMSFSYSGFKLYLITGTFRPRLAIAPVPKSLVHSLGFAFRAPFSAGRLISRQFEFAVPGLSGQRAMEHGSDLAQVACDKLAAPPLNFVEAMISRAVIYYRRGDLGLARFEATRVGARRWALTKRWTFASTPQRWELRFTFMPPIARIMPGP